MTLTRGPGEQCFVGIWSQGDNVYEAHIWAEAFPLLPPAPTSVPGPAGALLALLAAMVGAAGALVLGRKA